MEHRDFSVDSAELHGLPAFFTGAKLQRPQICTATDSEACHIVAGLSVWNEFLCQACIELREDAPGQLCLIFLDYHEFQSNGEEQIERAFLLVDCLLKMHRCLVGLHIYHYSDLNRLQKRVCFGSNVHHSLKSLIITAAKAPRLLRNISMAIPNLAKLEELKIGGFDLPDGFIEALCSLTSTSSCLKRFSLSSYELKSWEVEPFYAFLGQNCSLQELSVNTSSLLPGSENCCVDFARYLASAATLKTVEIYSTRYRLSRILEAVVLALSCSPTLLNITLDAFFIDLNGARAIEKFLAKNATVKTFTLQWCRWHGRHVWHAIDNSKYNTNNIGVLSRRIRPWISVLRKNRTLQSLTLNLSGFSPAECNAFFDELAKNPTIQKVTIEDIDLYCSKRGRRSSFPVAIRSSSNRTLERPDLLVAGCRQLSDLKLMYYGPDDSAWFKITLPALIDCRHITKLSLNLRFLFQDGVVPLVATYIAQTTVLQDLFLLLPWFLAPDNTNESSYRAALLGALEKNSSVRKLTLADNGFSSDELAFLAKIIRSSKVIHSFILYSFADQVETFLQHLSTDFSLNRTLVSLQFLAARVRVTRSFFVVRDVVRRNRDLVTYAAHFVMGNKSRRNCEALEAIGHNSVLVEKLREMSSVDEKTAVERVCKRLKQIRPVADFMRFAGVVQTRLDFYENPYHRLWLEDIDEYSWHSVRKFLRVSDVLRTSSDW